MTYLNLFDEIASIGRKIRKSTDRGHVVLSYYTGQLASICDLIKRTHLIVIEKLEAIDKAKTLADAMTIVQELRGTALSNIFRTNGLCDDFPGYGTSLRGIVEKYRDSVDPKNAPPMTQDEQTKFLKFCERLENREQSVATLYVDQIQGLRSLVLESSGQDLKQIKEYARQAKAILTDQVADFGALAVLFHEQEKRFDP